MRSPAALRAASRDTSSPAAASDRVLAQVARYFALLAEPSRLRILSEICRTERTVSAIVAATGLGQTVVSRHLGLLHRGGVVARRRDGSNVHYRVSDPAFVELCRQACVQIAAGIEARSPLRRELLAFASRH